MEAANATVTAQAGVRVRELQAALVGVGQWWPVLPPSGGEATVGGVLAAGRSGPLALRYGRLADRVTGLRLALPTGEIVRFGVSCVKNVAGYALEKLLVGSQGTLAAIVEATVRTAPLPPVARTAAWRARTETQAQELCRRGLTQSVRPAALEALSPAAAAQVGLPAEASEWVLVTAWHGLEAEVEAGEGALQAAARELGLEAVAIPEGAEEGLWAALADLPSPQAGPTLELSCAPSRCLEAMAAAAAATAEWGAPVLAASPGLGSMRVGLPPVEGETLRPALDLLRAVARTRGGSVRWLPPGWGEPLEQAPEPLAQLTRRLKEACDPAGILPGLNDMRY